MQTGGGQLPWSVQADREATNKVCFKHVQGTLTRSGTCIQGFRASVRSSDKGAIEARHQNDAPNWCRCHTKRGEDILRAHDRIGGGGIYLQGSTDRFHTVRHDSKVKNVKCRDELVSASDYVLRLLLHCSFSALGSLTCRRGRSGFSR